MPSTNKKKHFINPHRVFYPSCITPAPTFCTNASSNFNDNSATDAFLSIQFSIVTFINKKILVRLISYPQLQENDVNTYCADVFIAPMSVAAFLIKTGKNTTTAFSTLTCCPASNHSLTSLRIFFTSKVFPVDNSSKMTWLNRSMMLGTYSGWYLLILRS